MRSLRAQLIIAITTSALLMAAITGALLYHTLSTDLRQQFDRSIEGKARAITSLVAYDPSGLLEFQYSEKALPEYQQMHHGEYFVIYNPDGKVFAQSKSLPPQATLTTPSAARVVVDLTLPDGRSGRGLRLDFVPAVENEPGEINHFVPPSRKMMLVVARDCSTLDRALRTLLRALLAAGTSLALAIPLCAAFIIRRALQPLQRVADHCAALDATKLNEKLSQDGLPNELLPICSRLNDLLLRLNAAFLRERRFTANVAHELRTPIAELRSLAEVALKWPGDANTSTESLREALDIAEQMETLVRTLLTLVRCGDEEIDVPLQPVALQAAIAKAIQRIGIAANPIDVDVPPDAVVMADAALIESILINLFSNAIEYRRGDSPVRCEALQEDSKWVLAVENQVEAMSAEELSHLFEPFWRKDKSRTGSAHAGLGLALVATYCRLMGANAAALSPRLGVLRIAVSFSACSANVSPPVFAAAG